jgi:hypothetical protein
MTVRVCTDHMKLINDQEFFKNWSQNQHSSWSVTDHDQNGHKCLKSPKNTFQIDIKVRKSTPTLILFLLNFSDKQKLVLNSRYGY